MSARMFSVSNDIIGVFEFPDCSKGGPVFLEWLNDYFSIDFNLFLKH